MNVFLSSHHCSKPCKYVVALEQQLKQLMLLIFLESLQFNINFSLNMLDYK